jgi:hypothetical protein
MRNSLVSKRSLKLDTVRPRSCQSVLQCKRKRRLGGDGRLRLLGGNLDHGKNAHNQDRKMRNKFSGGQR